jgi:hypothetical protein
MVSKILNSKAVKNPLTVKPSTKFPASIIIIALITNKNNPKETMVAGKVKKISSGRTNMFNNEITIATHIEVTKLATLIPGKR